jgi:simple sugar transport system substrate-binding protein
MVSLFLVIGGSCGGRTAVLAPAAGETAEAVSAAALPEQPTVRLFLERSMPEAMADGMVKVAVVRNQAEGEHTRRFLAGCVSEGRSMGLTVDTFLTRGNDEYCQELIARIAGADYDGLIFSYGGADFSGQILMPVIEQGMKVVTFEARPADNGGLPGWIIPGVTGTVQGDEHLARLSLEAILAHFDESGPNPGRRPVRVIRAWAGPGIPELDRRQRVYDEFVREGKIEEAVLVSPRNCSFARGEVREALAAALSRLPQGSVDAVWAPHSEFAKGCADALYELGRLEIALVSIGLSNDDIKVMLDHPAVWLSAAAEDSGLIGVVNMRLLAAKLAGETTPDTHVFGGQLVETAHLNPATTMTNIAITVPGWEQEAGLFDQYPWMTELKAAKGKYVHLPPLQERPGQ